MALYSLYCAEVPLRNCSLTCVIVEYKYEQTDELDDDDETDRPLGLPSGIYGRGVQQKYYKSFSSFNNVDNINVCMRFLLKISIILLYTTVKRCAVLISSAI